MQFRSAELSSILLAGILLYAGTFDSLELMPHGNIIIGFGVFLVAYITLVSRDLYGLMATTAFAGLCGWLVVGSGIGTPILAGLAFLFGVILDLLSGLKDKVTRIILDKYFNL